MKMPSWMPMSSGVKVQANGTTLATRSFCAARAGANCAASGSMAPPARAVITRLRDNRLIVSSKGHARLRAGIGRMIAENGGAAPCGRNACAPCDGS